MDTRKKWRQLFFAQGLNLHLALSVLDVITKEGRVEMEETRAKTIPDLWMVGYGNWTGFASATLIGVGRSAKQTVEEIKACIQQR